MPSRAHLDELLEAIKGEFDNLTRETSRYQDDHHEYEIKLNQQHQELTNISNTVYELEQAHRSMKEAYEREIMKLKQELEVRDRLLEQQSLQQQAVAAQAQAHAHAQAHAQAQAQAQAQAHAQAQAQAAQSLNPTPYSQTPQQLPPPNLSSTSPPAYSNQLNKPDIFNNNSRSSVDKKTNNTLAPIAPLASSLPNPASVISAGSNNSTPSAASASNPAGSTSSATNPILHVPSISSNTSIPPITAKESSVSPSGQANNASLAADANTPATTNATINTKLSPSKKLESVEAASPSSNKAATYSGSKQLTKSQPAEEALIKRAQHNKPIPAFLKDFDAFASLPYKKQHNDYYLVYNPKIPKKVDISLVHSFDHTSVVCCVRFSKDGKFLATGCNKLTQVFSVETGDLVARLNDESSVSTNGGYDTDTGDLYIRSVCFSPDGKFLATGAEDKIIRIWDLATRTIVKYLKGHEQDIYSLDFFPDGKRLVSGSGDRTVRIWDVYNGQCSLTLSIEDGVTTVAVSPDGSLIAAGSLDRTVRVWDANKGYLVERLDSSNEYGNGHMDSVYSVTFTNQGKEIASGSLDRTIKLWSLKDLDKQPSSVSKSNCEVTYVGHKDFVLSVCCTPDDEFVLSGSKDRGVIMWNKETGEPYIMLQGHRNSVISVSVSPVLNPNGGYFATGSGDCKARIWKWERITEA
ncbi:hypothetical protein PMKS-003289 [Pichia membranifaciens]|uniref:Transcriptional repressor Tup1 N-terminal domain-containing protein n=1 Tax=Pichia membranifaciens TaxID=4926 RepID=A0A1Q2YJP6_9ASCO|nr:hypothetical protein PMKS-003289 [Pichia membranifaciens]